MQIENHKEEVPFGFYEEKFRVLDPQDAVARLGDIYRDGEFYVNLLGTQYAISHPDYQIRTVKPPLPKGGCPEGAGGFGPTLPVQTFLLRYLLEGRQEKWGGEWKTFREMPWGELYIQPYTGRVLTRAAYTLGTRLNAFRAAAEKLGALPLKNGDAGFEFELLPNLRMRILVWEADDEFPPSAQVLYSDNFTALAAEDRVVAGDILISTLKANM